MSVLLHPFLFVLLERAMTFYPELSGTGPLNSEAGGLSDLEPLSRDPAPCDYSMEG